VNTHRGSGIAFAVLATGAVLAGCGKAVSGRPSSAPGTGSSPSPEDSARGAAPQVAAPLKTGQLKTGMLLSDAMIKTLREG
jgi:hypothetical protein